MTLAILAGELVASTSAPMRLSLPILARPDTRITDSVSVMPTVEGIAPSAEPAGSYYVRLDDHRFRSTPHTEGAWQPGEQHMAAVSGVMVHAIE